MLKVWRIFIFIRRPFTYPPTLTFIVSIESGGTINIMYGDRNQNLYRMDPSSACIEASLSWVKTKQHD
jgi:hypothetical protein